MSVPENTTIDDYFPSRFMKADDMDKEQPIYTIADVSAEVIGEDQQNKLVVMFFQTTKSLVLNKTNASNLETMYGKNPNEWIGKHVKLYTEFVSFRGKSVEAVLTCVDGDDVILPDDQPGHAKLLSRSRDTLPVRLVVLHVQ